MRIPILFALAAIVAAPLVVGCERDDAMTPHEPADQETHRTHPPDFQGGGPKHAAPVPPTVAPGEPQPGPTEKPGADAGANVKLPPRQQVEQQPAPRLNQGQQQTMPDGNQLPPP